MIRDWRLWLHQSSVWALACCGQECGGGSNQDSVKTDRVTGGHRTTGATENLFRLISSLAPAYQKLKPWECEKQNIYEVNEQASLRISNLTPTPVYNRDSSPDVNVYRQPSSTNWSQNKTKEINSIRLASMVRQIEIFRLYHSHLHFLNAITQLGVEGLALGPICTMPGPALKVTTFRSLGQRLNHWATTALVSS